MRKHSFLKAIGGFTLIELIAVMALMAIAATFTVPIIMRNTEERQREVYYQGCVYVIGEAAAISDSFNKGAHTITGYSISSLSGVQTLLNLENSMSFKFSITVVGSAVNPSFSFPKDNVVVYFAYNAAKTKAVAVGAWYMAKGNTTPQIKYDYAKASKIDINTAFTAPVFS